MGVYFPDSNEESFIHLKEHTFIHPKMSRTTVQYLHSFSCLKLFAVFHCPNRWHHIKPWLVRPTHRMRRVDGWEMKDEKWRMRETKNEARLDEWHVAGVNYNVTDAWFSRQSPVSEVILDMKVARAGKTIYIVIL